MSATLDATGLAFAGAARQASLVASGALSARELTELYLGWPTAPSTASAGPCSSACSSW